MTSSALVTRTSIDSDDTIYSYNESPIHHFIKEEPNDADSDETPYSSDKEATPELYEVHCAVVDINALVKMVEHHVKPKPMPYVPIQDPPAEA
ncbi:uncharacterized protein G2W53_000759 [Senna tora]|uniref:Uncharacterized protein n=1 Tax=Senna tora TaxID=362788 RepID=A0A835CIT8_9FABA|nr:uncharacterized protein G2W53_000759 [Senna tora]